MASNIRCGMTMKAASYTSTCLPSCQALEVLACGQPIFSTTLTRQVESCNENECGVYYLNVTSYLHLLLWFLDIDLFLGKVGGICHSCTWPHWSSVTLALEPVVDKNQLLWDTRSLWHLGYHSLPSPSFPRYLFIDQPERKGEQLSEPHANCPAGIQTLACRFIARHAA